MHQLVYISAAVLPAREHGFCAILESAIRNNARDNITGMLLYHRGQFFQVLEGAKEKVHACFAKIKTDDRHTGIILLLDEPALQACFRDWSMASVGINDCEECLQSQIINLFDLRNQHQFDELHQNKVIGVFVDTYLSDLNRLAREVRLTKI